MGVGPGISDGGLRVGDRIVVPFASACGACASCRAELYSCCANSNPDAGISEKTLGHPTCGIYGYSHLIGGFTSGFACGQTEYVRVVLADANGLKIESHQVTTPRSGGAGQVSASSPWTAPGFGRLTP
ncbi:alcohol dehydrogenase catalytic domain-containing protein [Streptomyces sp. NPDC053780]|uniref:alcohol dehydrogenase catalytic domain-containing protein n=1 Tax=unclassified Streptomyces TaxID=2593676 RepID=UPI0028FDA874|nr:alcohol dehydrogenase catalytic domain-containing protein [Streptomyces sp. PAL114]MDU0300126.1 alcohol dehydrogenase catalytic domain-containing protein [Streptomyces sp. PAL114]